MEAELSNIQLNPTSVTIIDLEIKSTELSQYLAASENPSEALVDLIKIALDVRARFSTSLETQNIKDSAQSVIEKMDDTFEQIIKALKEKADLLVDPENGPIIKALDKATGDNLKKLLAPEDTYDQGPIARLRGMIEQDVEAFKEDVDAALLEIKIKLGISGTKRKTAADGVDFEAKVDGIIQDFARTYGDAAISVGAKAETGAAKKGDTEVVLNFEDTGNIECKIIWESKTDASFKSKSANSPKVVDNQVKNELNAAMLLRKAKVGILVLDTAGLDMEAQPNWREYEGNKLLVIVDILNPDPDLIRLAYLWGRWKAKSSLGSNVATVDYDGIKNNFDQIRLRLNDLRNVKKAHTDSINILNGASTLVDGIQKDTKRMMSDLAETIDIELAELPGELE
jgi:hypothetical protein